jgi:hypothetical protein
MKQCVAIGVLVCSVVFGADMARPKAGKTEIFPLKEIKPGLKATAWTVFQGTEPEPVPVEIVGVMRNYLGPNKDVILGKMGGKAKETNVAAGMSGSPVYIDGKLVGAVALRMSVFSPDAICGITPIESMLEVEDFDTSRPVDSRTPDKILKAQDGTPNAAALPLVMPMETPLLLSGFSDAAVRMFEPVFSQMGITPVQGGSSATTLTAKPAAGWQSSLNPGDAVSGILVSGDMSATGMGTVTYNDGKRVLAFGHPFYNLGPINMPMAKSEVLMVLSSAYQPTKFGNATEVVGALHQDRYSGIMGELGAEAPVVPVHVKVRSLGDGDKVLKEKDLNFNVFVHEKWTPFLMQLTLSNSLQQMNEFASDITYRMSGHVELDGGRKIDVSTMLGDSQSLAAPPMVLASWWADKFNRLFLNPVEMPKLTSVECTVDMLPDRRVATIDSAWTPVTEVDAGSDVPVKVFLRPFRGERVERDVTVKIPAGMPKGEHRILLSDADTLNRMRAGATAANRYLDIPETISLLNQERGNNRLYVSLVQARPTYFTEDKTMPSLPASILNVMQTERTSTRTLTGIADSTEEQLSVAFDQQVTGNYSLRITVR